MKSKVIIVGTKVQRLSESPSWTRRLKSRLTPRTVFGFVLMLIAVALLFHLILAGA
jgi:hypothetical protein